MLVILVRRHTVNSDSEMVYAKQVSGKYLFSSTSGFHLLECSEIMYGVFNISHRHELTWIGALLQLCVYWNWSLISAPFFFFNILPSGSTLRSSTRTCFFLTSLTFQALKYTHCWPSRRLHFYLFQDRYNIPFLDNLSSIT